MKYVALQKNFSNISIFFGGRSLKMEDGGLKKNYLPKPLKKKNIFTKMQIFFLKVKIKILTLRTLQPSTFYFFKSKIKYITDGGLVGG